MTECQQLTTMNYVDLQIRVGHVSRYETDAQRQHLPSEPLGGSWISGHEG